MKAQGVVLTCQYSKEGKCIIQIIQSSFNTFLKKELHNIEKHLYSNVS